MSNTLDDVVPSFDTVKTLGVVLVAAFAGYVAWKAFNTGKGIADTVGKSLGGVSDTISQAVVDTFGAKPGIELTPEAAMQADANAELLRQMDDDFKRPPTLGYEGVGWMGIPVVIESPSAVGGAGGEW